MADREGVYVNEASAAESWRPVVGWEGLYEVSDQGRVRSLDRVIVNAAGAMQRFRGRTLRPTTTPNGYRLVALCHRGYRRDILVHRLALEAFTGPAPEGHEACHWDGDRNNNNISNLRWDTKSANIKDNVRNGVHPMSRRTHCIRRHLLEVPNLTQVGLRAGKRLCLACARGHADVSNARRDGRPVPEFIEAAGRHYKLILGAA